MSHSNTEDSSPSRHKAYDDNTKLSLGKRKYDTNTPVSSQQANLSLGGAIMDEGGRMSGVKPIQHPDLDSSIAPSDTVMPDWHNSVIYEEGPWWTDGTDKRGRRAKPAVAAIFVHAGAGYHSTANEKLHLDACSECVSPTIAPNTYFAY
jgi:hypothetical protein